MVEFFEKKIFINKIQITVSGLVAIVSALIIYCGEAGYNVNETILILAIPFTLFSVIAFGYHYLYLRNHKSMLEMTLNIQEKFYEDIDIKNKPSFLISKTYIGKYSLFCKCASQGTILVPYSDIIQVYLLVKKISSGAIVSQSLKIRCNAVNKSKVVSYSIPLNKRELHLIKIIKIANPKVVIGLPKI